MRINSAPVEVLMRKCKALRRELLEKPDLLEVRIAVLSGSTTDNIVLRRDMELAILDALIAVARQRGINEIRGYYLRTPINDMVCNHYQTLGFQNTEVHGPARSEWKLQVADYVDENKHIKELVHG